MSRDEIIAMAREAGCVSAEFWPGDFAGLMGVFERFAAMVAAKEREACALICEKTWVEPGDAQVENCHEAAASIRARGKP